MTKTKYSVTDSRGKVHTRTSPRTYTHAVVHHVPARDAEGNWLARAAYSNANWCGSLKLAQKEAAQWGRRGLTTEIIEVGAK